MTKNDIDQRLDFLRYAERLKNHADNSLIQQIETMVQGGFVNGANNDPG